jgi:hypothetical protein
MTAVGCATAQQQDQVAMTAVGCATAEQPQSAYSVQYIVSMVYTPSHGWVMVATALPSLIGMPAFLH